MRAYPGIKKETEMAAAIFVISIALNSFQGINCSGPS
jgi:hypothetical protein